MACIIYKTKKPIANEDEFADFYEGKRKVEKTYPFVDQFNASNLAWIGGLSYWQESDAIESSVEKETGIKVMDQILMDEMHPLAKEKWLDFTRRVSEISDEAIEKSLPAVVEKMPEGEVKDASVWRDYFKVKRNYLKAIVAAGIDDIEVFI